MNFKGGKYVDDSARLAKAFRHAAHKALRRLGFLIRGTAQKSILDRAGPSQPGEPPHTHSHTKFSKQGKPRKGSGVLPGAILYAEVEPMAVVVGPSKELAGTVGAAFEHEGTTTFRGEKYPPRPFMGPALGAEIGKLPGILAEQNLQVQ